MVRIAEKCKLIQQENVLLKPEAICFLSKFIFLLNTKYIPKQHMFELISESLYHMTVQF